MSRLAYLMATLPVAAGLTLASAAPAVAAAKPAPPVSDGSAIGWLGGVISGQGFAIGGRTAPAVRHPASRPNTVSRPTTVRHAAPRRRVPLGPVAATVPAPAAASPASTSVANATVAHTATAQVGVTLSPYEARLLSLVNGARAAAGVAPLRAVPGATDVARRWSAQLAQAGSLSHNPSLVNDLSAAGSYSWHTIAENVGAAPAGDADALFSAYLSSPKHRANILDANVTVIGIGAIAVDGPFGPTAWNVMDFADAYDDSYGASVTHPLTAVLEPLGVAAAFG